MKQILLAFSIILSQFSFGQNITQTVKGTITDKVSEKPLQGVTVVLLNQKTQTNSMR